MGIRIKDKNGNQNGSHFHNNKMMIIYLCKIEKNVEVNLKKKNEKIKQGKKYCEKIEPKLKEDTRTHTHTHTHTPEEKKKKKTQNI